MAKKLELFSREVRDYRIKQQLKILRIGEFPKLKTQLVKRDNPFHYYSHNMRIIRNWRLMKDAYIQHKTNNIFVTFRVSVAGASAVYANLYAQYIPGAAESTKFTSWCCGGSFESQDGEYRSRLLPFARFVTLMEKYRETIEIVERMIADKMNSAALAFHADFFYPANFSGSERQFESTVDSLRVAIKFYAVCWIRDYHYAKNGIIENHMSPTYRHIVYRPEDVGVYESILSQLGLHELEIMIIRITKCMRILDRTDDTLPLECGQKIFPITAFEAIKVHDINFSVWRELYISNLCTDLALNFVSPSFPCINNWFIIENAHVGLFDNPAMHVRYRQSAIAESISRQLRDIDRTNYTDSRRELGPINSKFMRLSKHIQKSIVYADSAIKLTDLAICVTSENVGLTYRDLPAYISKNPAYGYNRIFADSDAFSKYAFETIYALYCMNTKCALLHGDLHTNNATIYRFYNIRRLEDSSRKNFHVLFAVRDRAYVFQHYGLYSCIIDFSRAVIGDMALIEDEFGERFADIFAKEQRIRVMRILFTHFSKFMERNHDEIERLLTDNLQLMFKILTAVDAFVFFNGIKAVLTTDKHFKSGEVKLSQDVVKLATKIADAAEASLLENLIAAIEGRVTSAAQIEWPNYRFLRKFFEKFETTDGAIAANPEINVVDMYNYSADLRYHIDNYGEWGPILSVEYEEQMYKKYGLDVPQAILDMKKFETMDDNKPVERLVDKYEHREQDVINIEPWMLY